MSFTDTLKKQGIKRATSFTDTLKKEIVQEKYTQNALAAQKNQLRAEKNAIVELAPKAALNLGEVMNYARTGPKPLPISREGYQNIALQTQKEQALAEKDAIGKVPYVETYKEVHKNFSSGNVLGGLGNSAKGTGQMILQGLSGPQKLILNASKAIIDTSRGKKATFDPNLSAEKYLDETGNEQTRKFYSGVPGQITSGVFNLTSDPLTWMGGGIADDVMKTTVKGTEGVAKSAKTGEKLSNKLIDNKLTKSLNDKLSVLDKRNLIPESAVQKSLVTANKVEDVVNDTDNALNVPQKVNESTNINTSPLPQKQVTMANKSIAEDIGLKGNSTTYQLPDTAEELTKLVSDMEAQQRKGIKINLQLFAEAQKKLSQFKSNTIERSTLIPDYIKKELDPKEFEFIQESSKDWQEKALENVFANRDKVMNEIKQANSISGGVQAHEAAVITSSLIDEVRKTNSTTALKTWLKTVAEKTRETARALKGTDTAWDKKTAEGALTDAQRVVDKVERDIEKANPNKVKKINEETKKVTDTINKANKEAAKEIEKLLPEERLANKISGTLSSDKTRNADPITDMVNELFKSAKESPLPGKVAALKRNPIEYLTQAIQNKGQYTDVWDKAKEILKQKYSNNPEATAMLNDFFEKGIIPTYSNSTLNNSVQLAMKGLGQKLEAIAKSSKGDKEQALKELTDYLITTTGATTEEATLLAQKIQTRFDQLVKEKSQFILKQMFREIVPKGQKSMYEKVMEIVNLGGYDDAAIRDLIKQKEGLPILDDTDISFIIENMDKAKSLVDGSYEQRMLQAKVAKRIADKIPSTVGEKLQAAQRISMLLNPKTTVVRNPLGNALLGGLESVKNIVATPIDMATSAIRKSERTTTIAPLTKLGASAQGAKKGIKEWALDIKNGIDTSPTGGQVEMPKNKIFSENHNISNTKIKAIADFGGKTANKVHGIVGRMLQVGDRPFYEAAYNSRIAELKKLRKTNAVTEAMQEDAKLHAFERTLQNDSGMAELFTGLKKGKFISDNHPEARATYQFIANLVMPFTKTPANILDKFIDYSPLGALKATTKALKTAGKGTFNQKKFVDTMARSLTGTGLATVGYLMAKNGLITGDRDPNNKVEGIETALGKQNYAFKVGDNYYTYDWGLPAAAPLAMGADVYNAIAKRKDGDNAFLKGSESAVNLLFNSTLLRGPSGFTGGYSPAVALGKGLLGTTTQATPTAGKQLAQLIDPYQRETYDPNVFKQTLNKTIARIPFASKTLPAKVDIFGNEIKAFQGKNNVWNVMFNPGFSTTYKPNEEQKEIIRLYEDAGTTDQLPAIAEKYISETKQNPRINLTAQEYTQYQKRIGQLTADRFKETMNTPAYRNAQATKDLTDDEVRAKMLGDIVSKAKKQAKKEILEKQGYTIK